MSCTTASDCPAGQRCFQLAYNEFKCVNNTTPRGGTVLEPNSVFAKATSTLDDLINAALGKPKPAVPNIIPKNLDFKKPAFDTDYFKDEEEDTDTNTKKKTTTTPFKPPASTTPPPPVATNTIGGFNPQRTLEWLKANPIFTIIAAGVLFYALLRMGK